MKIKITGKTATDNNNGNIAGRINFEIIIRLKNLSNIWGTLEIPLINCEVELILSCSANCVIIYTDIAGQVPPFIITESNLYVPVTQDNATLLPQLKSGF